MRVIIMAFICLGGGLILCLWAVGFFLAIRSGKGLFALFSQAPRHHWLSISETSAEYGDEHYFPPD
jgi:hypothetical protein